MSRSAPASLAASGTNLIPRNMVFVYVFFLARVLAPHAAHFEERCLLEAGLSLEGPSKWPGAAI